jgi:alpha-ketoglutarate-dependent taurine dioxygenase
MASIILPGPQQPYVIVGAEIDKSLLSIDESMIVPMYKEYGAILLRGYTLNLESFRGLVRKFCICSIFNESPDRELLDVENNIQTVFGGSDALPLHAEMSRDPWAPDVCFFGCLSQPTEGGETVICDGIEIADNMEQELFDIFEPRRLLHAQFATPKLCEYWLGTPAPDDSILQNPPESCPYSFFRVNGRIVRSFTRPVLRSPMFSDELGFVNFLLYARYQLRITNFPVFDNREIIPDSLTDAVKSICDEIAVPVKWQKGDVVMIDNTRFMHARNAIVDVRERRIISYFGYLRFAEPSEEEPVNARWRQPGFRPPYLVS